MKKTLIIIGSVVGIVFLMYKVYLYAFTKGYEVGLNGQTSIEI